MLKSHVEPLKKVLPMDQITPDQRADVMQVTTLSQQLVERLHACVVAFRHEQSGLKDPIWVSTMITSLANHLTHSLDFLTKDLPEPTAKQVAGTLINMVATDYEARLKSRRAACAPEQKPSS